MVLFGVSERPVTALDSSAPRLLRMAPLRHSLRVAPRLDARDCDDTASTLSAPGYGEADGGSGKFVRREACGAVYACGTAWTVCGDRLGVWDSLDSVWGQARRVGQLGQCVGTG
jgi:hypothetical protein